MTRVREPIKDSSVVKYWMIAPWFISLYLLVCEAFDDGLYTTGGVYASALCVVGALPIYYLTRWQAL